jgi:Fe-S-cluster containining protein
MPLKNVCKNHHCVSCCHETEMLLLNDDVRRIEGLGFRGDFFISKFRGFKKLKNSNGRCVFHDGEQCTIYSNRPSGCRLYPVIFDEDLNRPVRDTFCPFRKEFSLSFKVRHESAKLYQELISERQANRNKNKHLERGP